MSGQATEGACPVCHESFEYALLHSGFNDSAYAYCDRCGTTAVLDGWAPDIPPEVGFQAHAKIARSVESLLAPCLCGGRFTADAVPRCPHCFATLDPESVRPFIESNAPGTRQGWRWQGNWNGLYAIVVDGRIIRDPWQHRQGGPTPAA